MMKKLFIFVILFATFGAVQAQKETAPTALESTESSTLISARPSGLFPLGSYQDTCTDVKFDGSTLTATCKNKKQESVTASLSGINNDDFILNMDGKFVKAPKGSYVQTCTDIRFDGSLLIAKCQKKDKSVAFSSLLVAESSDSATIINDDGKLVSAPEGSYLNTCTDIKFDGSTLTANCQKRDKSFVAVSLSGIKEGDYILNDDGKLVAPTFSSDVANIVPQAPPIKALTQQS